MDAWIAFSLCSALFSVGPGMNQSPPKSATDVVGRA